MMKEAIRHFPEQFLFEPVVERVEKLPNTERCVVSGMGGSHLAADLLQTLYPESRITVHMSYGLPSMAEVELRRSLFIASSYSGNTEEVLDGLEKAQAFGMPCAAVSKGGLVEEVAEKYGIPYVRLPHADIQPRLALGFSMLGIMKLLSMNDEIQKLRMLADMLQPDALEPEGKKLAAALRGKIPIVYASLRNRHIAANWKIKCNETGKIPAFYNIFPELNHNEMTGLDVVKNTKELSRQFHCIFLRDTEDDPRIQKRMDVCKKLYEDRDVPVTEVPLEGASRWERMFSSLLVADWFSFHTGVSYGVETEQVPMVEEFKKLIST